MSVFHSPPMPEWSGLRNEEQAAMAEALDFWICPRCCGAVASDFYDAIRDVLIEREKRIFRATMTEAGS